MKYLIAITLFACTVAFASSGSYEKNGFEQVTSKKKKKKKGCGCDKILKEKRQTVY